MKESFILYKSLYQAIKDLSDAEKGQLFDAIFQRQLELPVRELSPMLQMAFKFVESQFERDDIKYQKIVERNKFNGSKGGRPNNNPDEPKKPSGLSGNPENPNNPDEPKKPDTDTVSDTVSDTGKKKRRTFSPPSIDEFSKYFTDNGFSVELAQRAFKGYDAANWHDSEDKPIKNWKQKCHFVWFKHENRTKIGNSPQSQSIKEISGW